MNYTIPEDIANRGLQLLGATRIGSFSDNSKNAAEASFVYDKCRIAELRSNLWNFAARRVILRPYTPGTSMIWLGQLWVSSTTYPVGVVVPYNGLNYISVINGNLNNVPGTGYEILAWQNLGNPTIVNPWAPGSYYNGEMTSLNGILYITSGPTTATPGFLPWIVIPAQILPVTLFAPLGVTTNSLTTPKFVYPLPNNYLRVMPQDPKTAATPAQLTTAGMQAADFEFESSFLFTNATKGNPLAFRYIANNVNVTTFDPLFAEALACRIALELCEVLTQSPQKIQAINNHYNEAVTKAIRINAIEAGSTEPDANMVDSQRGPTREKVPQPRQQQQ